MHGGRDEDHRQANLVHAGRALWGLREPGRLAISHRQKATWHNLAEVRDTFRHADSVGDKTVFNIIGNDYRLIVYIDYTHARMYVKHLLTHAEYDKGAWQDE
jgi:mRNA-degrading endonuclease HigB of HigAB toxin-antitoxin module